MAKDLIGTYSDSFKSTSKAKELAAKYADLKKAYKDAIEPYETAYKKGMAKVDADRNYFGFDLGWVNSKYSELNKIRIKGIDGDVKVKEILASIENLREEKKKAIISYAKKIEGNEAWNGVCNRKRSIKILSTIAMGNYTESELDRLVYDKSEIKANENGQRLGFPIKYFVALGWIGRDNVGHNATHFITDEGKRQIEFYEKNGFFDSSNVA